MQLSNELMNQLDKMTCKSSFIVIIVRRQCWTPLNTKTPLRLCSPSKLSQAELKDIRHHDAALHLTPHTSPLTPHHTRLTTPHHATLKCRQATSTTR